jgi:hypothetical protein
MVLYHALTSGDALLSSPDGNAESAVYTSASSLEGDPERKILPAIFDFRTWRPSGLPRLTLASRVDPAAVMFSPDDDAVVLTKSLDPGPGVKLPPPFFRIFIRSACSSVGFIAGNSNTSLMFHLLVKNMHRRSMPTPQPPVGGSAYSIATQKSSSCTCHGKNCHQKYACAVSEHYGMIECNRPSAVKDKIEANSK